MDVAGQVGEGTAATCYGQQGDGPGWVGLQGPGEARVTTTPGLLGQAWHARRPLPNSGRLGLEASTGVRVRVPGPRSGSWPDVERDLQLGPCGGPNGDPPSKDTSCPGSAPRALPLLGWASVSGDRERAEPTHALNCTWRFSRAPVTSGRVLAALGSHSSPACTAPWGAWSCREGGRLPTWSLRQPALSPLGLGAESSDPPWTPSALVQLCHQPARCPWA